MLFLGFNVRFAGNGISIFYLSSLLLIRICIVLFTLLFPRVFFCVHQIKKSFLHLHFIILVFFSSEGDVIKSKHVIVTLPLGVLKQESVQFVPPLDDRKVFIILYSHRMKYSTW